MSSTPGLNLGDLDQFDRVDQVQALDAVAVPWWTVSTRAWLARPYGSGAWCWRYQIRARCDAAVGEQRPERLVVDARSARSAASPLRGLRGWRRPIWTFKGHGFGVAPPGAVGLGDQTHPAGSSSSRWMKRTATGC